jgi:hypothetical protein
LVAAVDVQSCLEQYIMAQVAPKKNDYLYIYLSRKFLDLCSELAKNKIAVLKVSQIKIFFFSN